MFKITLLIDEKEGYTPPLNLPLNQNHNHFEGNLDGNQMSLLVNTFKSELDLIINFKNIQMYRCSNPSILLSVEEKKETLCQN